MSYDPTPDRGSMTPGQRWATGLVLLLILGPLLIAIFKDFEPVKLSPILIMLCWMVLLVTHEGGHAVAAYLLGWRIKRTVIGMGGKIAEIRIGRVPVEIRAIPVEGFVETAPRNLEWPRLKSILIYFAGPETDLLLGAIALFLVGTDQFGYASESYLHILWQCFVAAAFAQGILNLIPHAVFTPQGQIANDGLGILRSFSRTDEYYAAMIEANADDW